MKSNLSEPKTSVETAGCFDSEYLEVLEKKIQEIINSRKQDKDIADRIQSLLKESNFESTLVQQKIIYLQSINGDIGRVIESFEKLLAETKVVGALEDEYAGDDESGYYYYKYLKFVPSDERTTLDRISILIGPYLVQKAMEEADDLYRWLNEKCYDRRYLPG